MSGAKTRQKEDDKDKKTKDHHQDVGKKVDKTSKKTEKTSDESDTNTDTDWENTMDWSMRDVADARSRGKTIAERFNKAQRDNADSWFPLLVATTEYLKTSSDHPDTPQLREAFIWAFIEHSGFDAAIRICQDTDMLDQINPESIDLEFPFSYLTRRILMEVIGYCTAFSESGTEVAIRSTRRPIMPVIVQLLKEAKLHKDGSTQIIMTSTLINLLGLKQKYSLEMRNQLLDQVKVASFTEAKGGEADDIQKDKRSRAEIESTAWISSLADWCVDVDADEGKTPSKSQYASCGVGGFSLKRLLTRELEIWARKAAPAEGKHAILSLEFVDLDPRQLALIRELVSIGWFGQTLPEFVKRLAHGSAETQSVRTEIMMVYIQLATACFLPTWTQGISIPGLKLWQELCEPLRTHPTAQFSDCATTLYNMCTRTPPAKVFLEVAIHTHAKPYNGDAQRLQETYNRRWCHNQGTCIKREEPDQPKFKRCSQCNIVYYCSRACQCAHWKQHKLLCMSSTSRQSTLQLTSHSTPDPEPEPGTRGESKQEEEEVVEEKEEEQSDVQSDVHEQTLEEL